MEWLLFVGIVVAVVPVAWWVGRLSERSALQPTLRELERKSSGAEAEGGQLGKRLDEAQERAESLEQKFQEAERGRVHAEARIAELEHSIADQLGVLDEAKTKLSDTFKALAGQALKDNAVGFLTLADEKFKALSKTAEADLEVRQKAIEGLVSPLTETLDKFDKQVRAIEEKRAEAYGGVLKEIELIRSTEALIQQETGNLVKALRQPTVAGRWGEMQLRRVVELAEMVEHCDFVEQEGVSADDAVLRPDMVVHMPGGKLVVVDAKCPLQAYLDAVEATTDEERGSKLKQHARVVSAHIQRLSAKAYWEQFHPTPKFVILFLPGENLFRAALENDPNLIDQAITQRVVPASPTTLISHLRAIHYGWQQEQLAENAEQISRLGRELHERIGNLAVHVTRLRNYLDKSVESFNGFVGSLEGRVLPLARRFRVLGAGSDKQIPVITAIDRTTRAIRVVEGEGTTDAFGEEATPVDDGQLPAEAIGAPLADAEVAAVRALGEGIHEEEDVLKRASEHLGYLRLGSAVRSQIERALRSLEARQVVHRSGSEMFLREAPLPVAALETNEEGANADEGESEPHGDIAEPLVRNCVICGSEFSQLRRQGRPFERCEKCRSASRVLDSSHQTSESDDVFRLGDARSQVGRSSLEDSESPQNG